MTGDGSGTQNSNEPKNSKFKQQQLPAWQPILTAGTVLPTFFVIGIAFIPIGVGLMYFSNQVNEEVINYTECKSQEFPDKKCSDTIAEKNWNPNNTCICEVPFNLSSDSDWVGPVYMYYGLTNFYQNHRRYVKSRDDKQLYGMLSNPPSKDCAPFRQVTINNETLDEYYAPCGAIANSLFSDKIRLQYRDGASWKDVDLLKTGIAWPSDKEYKFKNPEYTRSDDKDQDWKNLRDAFTNAKLRSPKDWKTPLWELDKENPDNNGFLNEDLIVWMRTAALPNFRKLYRKVDHKEGTDFAEGLPKNKDYRLQIEYNYKVVQFSGTKKIILATTSLLGGKNPFLGIAYIVVGCICLVLGVIFLFIHLRFGKTPQDILNIGPRTPYNAN